MRLTTIAITLASAALLGTNPLNVQAQEAPAATTETTVLPELPDDVKQVLEGLDAAAKDLEDVEARLTYEESIPLLEKTRRSRGKLLFKKPTKIALKLGKPHREEVYTDGKVWWVVSHQDEQAQRFLADADGSTDAPEAAFMKFGFGEGAMELAQEYKVTLEDETTEDDVTTYHLKFIPRERKDMPVRYQAIKVKMTDVHWLPHEIVLEEPGGEIVHTYRLRNIERNEGIKDDVFDYDPPGGYTVVEPQER